MSSIFIAIGFWCMGETKKEILTRLKNIEAKLEVILKRMELTLPVDDKDTIGGIELAIQITGLAKSSVYNLVCARAMPHYKKGKRLYFKRKELEDWIAAGKRKTMEEIPNYLR